MAITKICRHRDRVRHPDPRGRRVEPDRRVLAADQRLPAREPRKVEPAAAPNVGWDFEDESPGNDARGGAAVGAMAPEVETHLVNAVLTNGARYYVDHAHPELSTPECADARSIVVFDRAAEQILHRVDGRRPTGCCPRARRSSSTRTTPTARATATAATRTTSWTASCPFGRIVTHVTPHFITRQIFTGAGKVGTEAGGLSHDDVPFQLTQRADFFEEEVGLETTLKRPIVNTRDEPHCDASKYRRLHVIVGDANLSEVATFLKVGTTAHRAGHDRGRRPAARVRLQRAGVGPAPGVLRPDACARRSSWSTARPSPRSTCSGSCSTGPASTPTSFGLECVGEAVGDEILRRWEAVLTGLETDPMSLADQLDWVAKYRLIDGYRERHDLAWDDARLAAMDLQYHDLRPAKSLFARLGLRAPHRRRRGHARPAPSRRPTPGPTSGASACSAGPTTSSPPTGTRWCSTSAASPCAGCR